MIDILVNVVVFLFVTGVIGGGMLGLYFIIGLLADGFNLIQSYRENRRAKMEREEIANDTVYNGHRSAVWQRAINGFLADYGRTYNMIMQTHHETCRKSLKKIQKSRKQWKTIDIEGVTDLPQYSEILYNSLKPSTCDDLKIVFGTVVNNATLRDLVDKMTPDIIAERLKSMKIPKNVARVILKKTADPAVRDEAINQMIEFADTASTLMMTHARLAAENFCELINWPYREDMAERRPVSSTEDEIVIHITGLAKLIETYIRDE